MSSLFQYIGGYKNFMLNSDTMFHAAGWSSNLQGDKHILFISLIIWNTLLLIYLGLDPEKFPTLRVKIMDEGTKIEEN